MIELDLRIIIKDTATGDYITIPQTPEKVGYKEGETQADTIKIVNLGDVDFINGKALGEMTWTCTFPGRYDPSYCKGSNIMPPVYYRDTIKEWKEKGIPLQVIVAAAALNATMYVKSFEWDFVGFEGDIEYSIGLKEYKVIKPMQIDVTTAVDGSIVVANNAAETRIAPPATPPPPTYTVVAGDCLCLIGKKLGKDWHDIYEKNKAIIGPDPNRISPGQVFML